jgi:Flp pilus assembly protein TadG
MTALKGDRGSVTLLMVVFVTALIVCLGLVVDGGAKLQAVQQANRIAAEAARTAAQQLDVPTVQSGRDPVLLAPRAMAAADAVLRDAGAEGSVAVEGDRVRVTAVVRRPTVVLGLIGLSEVGGTGSASAELTIR